MTLDYVRLVGSCSASTVELPDSVHINLTDQLPECAAELPNPPFEEIAPLLIDICGCGALGHLSDHAADLLRQCTLRRPVVLVVDADVVSELETIGNAPYHGMIVKPNAPAVGLAMCRLAQQRFAAERTLATQTERTVEMNRLLRVMRTIGRAARHGAVSDQVIEEACRELTAIPSCRFAWYSEFVQPVIDVHAPLPPLGKAIGVGSSDFVETFNRSVERGAVPPCIERALRDRAYRHRMDDHPLCRTCPARSHDASLGAIIVPIESAKGVMGVFMIRVDARVIVDDPLANLYEETAAELSRAIRHTLDARYLSGLEERVRDADERMMMAAEAAHLGWWVADVNSGVVDVRWWAARGNESQARRFTHDELRGAVDDEGMLHVRTAYNRVVEGTAAALDVTALIALPGLSRPTWIRAVGRATRHDAHGGVAQVSGVIVDVDRNVRTERKLAAALAEKELLMKEVHHRAKNNFNAVAALLSLRAGNAPNPYAADSLNESRNHVVTLLHLYEMLFSSTEYSRVDLGRLLSSIAEHLRVAYSAVDRGIELVVTLPSVEVSSRIATTLALTVNELISNAFKHAFPADRGGRIELTGHVPDDGSIEIRIRDDGIGIAGHLIDDTGSRADAGFGLQMVHSMLDQIGAHLKVCNQRGSCFVVRLAAVSQQV